MYTKQSNVLLSFSSMYSHKTMCTDRQIDILTNMQTDRENDKQAVRQTDKENEK
jgi:hypothetical protein